jgi:hypothetical protein
MTKRLDRHDERARTGPGFDPSLGNQLVVSLLHHGSGHTEVAGELPAARQPVASAEPVVSDRIPHLRGNLLCERWRSPAVEFDNHLSGHTMSSVD